jgi:hypothetical protein
MRRFDRWLVCGIVAVIWLIAGSRSGLIASDEPTRADPNDTALIHDPILSETVVGNRNQPYWRLYRVNTAFLLVAQKGKVLHPSNLLSYLAKIVPPKLCISRKQCTQLRANTKDRKRQESLALARLGKAVDATQRRC